VRQAELLASETEAEAELLAAETIGAGLAELAERGEAMTTGAPKQHGAVGGEAAQLRRLAAEHEAQLRLVEGQLEQTEADFEECEAELAQREQQLEAQAAETAGAAEERQRLAGRLEAAEAALGAAEGRAEMAMQELAATRAALVRVEAEAERGRAGRREERQASEAQLAAALHAVVAAPDVSGTLASAGGAAADGSLASLAAGLAAVASLNAKMAALVPGGGGRVGPPTVPDPDPLFKV
jgi:chromosome segregation ATPase